MSLAIFNGSPRGVKSNSSIITSWFLNGYKNDHQIFFLNKVKQYETYLSEANAFDEFLFIMPLYVDGMPGQVKRFMEDMYQYREQFAGKKVTFIIHSGFSEGVHCRALERYLNRFSDLMKMDNRGVIILPGSEGFRVMPENMTKKKSSVVATLGSQYMNNEPYEQNLLAQLVGKETTSATGKLLFPILSKLGLTNIYWNQWLKRNNAFDKRFDAPYSKSPFEE